MGAFDYLNINPFDTKSFGNFDLFANSANSSAPSFGGMQSSLFGNFSFNNFSFGNFWNNSQDIMSSMFNFNSAFALPTWTKQASPAANVGGKVAKNYVKKPLSNNARAEIKKIAKELNFDPQALIGVIYAESGGNPQAVNKLGGATGIIQFMPKTAQSLGTTTAELARMNVEQQLVYVKKYLINAKRSAGFAPNEKLSNGQLYALVFMPGKAKKDILCSAGTKAYAWNKGLDANKDGKITTQELGQRIA